ncbi:hypothetical protein ZWY2020_026573 [Hordeum vulgare]|nr:hypothetical protein ZWY2020_026573 [Hordeum vulgare]
MRGRGRRSHGPTAHLVMRAGFGGGVLRGCGLGGLVVLVVLEEGKRGVRAGDALTPATIIAMPRLLNGRGRGTLMAGADPTRDLGPRLRLLGGCDGCRPARWTAGRLASLSVERMPGLHLSTTSSSHLLPRPSASYSSWFLMGSVDLTASLRWSKIKRLNHRISHESISLDEEKRLIKEIKTLEKTRPKVTSNAAKRAKMQDTVVERDAIQDQVKTPLSLSLPIRIIGDGIDGVKKERQGARSKIKVLDDEMKVVDGEIALLQEDLNAATARKDKAYESLTELRKLRDLDVL